MTTWRVKRGDDWTAPSDINPKKDGTAIGADIGEWVAACEARPSEDANTAVTVDVTVTEDNKLRLSIPRDRTADMEAGTTWVLDVELTHDTYGRHSSETIELSVAADVTRVAS